MTAEQQEGETSPIEGIALSWNHIKNYVPGLKARLSRLGIFNLDSECPNPRRNEWGIIDSIQIDKGIVAYGTIRLADGYSFDFETLDEIEIGMYSLDLLTKEVEVNGERFVPIVELLKIKFPSKELYNEEIAVGISGYPHAFYRYSALRDLMINTNDILKQPYWIIQKLYEWKFAIDIPEHLYVNINDIEK